MIWIQTTFYTAQANIRMVQFCDMFRWNPALLRRLSDVPGTAQFPDQIDPPLPCESPTHLEGVFRRNSPGDKAER